MEELNFSTGVTEFKVNGGRVIRFNSADPGFLDTVCSLGMKLDAIRTDLSKKKADKSDDPAKVFDYERLCEKRMREAMDSVFGEGFSNDVFQELRLYAMADGLMLYENFIFSIMDKMDESICENLNQREGRIAKYTAKYTEKYRKARHESPME